MLFSRECDYGLRILRNLKMNEVTSVSNIVGHEYMSVAMGYKVARKLELAGLIRSQRGHTGGYLLTRGLDEITLYDAYTAIDPNIFITDCLRTDFDCPMKEERGEMCRVHCELKRIQSVLVRELKAKSLLQIVTEDPAVEVS